MFSDKGYLEILPSLAIFFFYLLLLVVRTDYGCPMKPFFIEIQNFWALADKLGRKNSGEFEVFSANLSAHILVL
jgi:hypothetical protein